MFFNEFNLKNGRFLPVCDLLAFRDGQSKPGIVAIFAPKDSLFAAMVQDFGDSYSIPVLHYSQAFQPDRSADSVFINLYPHFSTVKVLLRDTVDFYNWTKFAILFEDEDSEFVQSINRFFFI